MYATNFAPPEALTFEAFDASSHLFYLFLILHLF